MKKFSFWNVTHWKLASEVKSIIHLITCQALIYVNDNFKQLIVWLEYNKLLETPLYEFYNRDVSILKSFKLFTLREYVLKHLKDLYQ